MTPQEFKAWFDGFTEAFTGCPTKAQWARIKERVAEIDGRPVTERVYVDRYWPSYIPYNSYPHRLGGLYYTSGIGVAQNSASTNVCNQMSAGSASSFNSMQAMADLGREDAKALAA
jgi:hypothetical protein